ncbi:hypothetical protein KAR91_17645 [Candidatus Pacearchaeota archaeon]|nr:hypothetical protein [Candidatus Pacearchaeota archaeon]
MAVIKVEEPKEAMIDVGEMVRDYDDDCCSPISESVDKPKKMKKSYPGVYLYEAPDELFNALSVGTEYELTIKCKVTEMTERVSDSERDGKEEKRTINLEIQEVSKP